jgi:hypothetical protein
MSNCKISVGNGGKSLLVEIPLEGKGLTSSLKSVMLGTTSGFQDVGELPGVQVSINVIREATDEEVLSGAKPDELRAAIASLQGKSGKRNDAAKGRFVRLLDQMQGHKAGSNGTAQPASVASIAGVKIAPAQTARVA